MGYHRPIDHFNPGKQQEAEDRKYFAEPHDGVIAESSADSQRNASRQVASSVSSDGYGDYLRYSGEL